MSLIKTPQEIESLKRGGEILSAALSAAMRACVVGASTEDIDRIARESMERAGAKPSFLGYRIDPHDPAYPSTLCISINDEVVHAPATPARIVQDGDVVGLDIGAWYEGLTTDMAATVAVGKVKEEERELIIETRRALEQALKVVRSGAWISEIGAAIEDYLKPHGYGIIRDLVGHGVGHAVHEDPQIPNFRDPRASKVQMRTGMVLAIEPMVALGSWKIYQKTNGWSLATRDGSMAAHWEVTVAVTDDGYDLITPWPNQL
ncbi:MAG: type I methionyl aminopeptidase [Patescibacteria group bacterium]|nr:type I methionyl aminopeptidase [Patescibacteria group bacterium]